jgi:hypothetical protein
MRIFKIITREYKYVYEIFNYFKINHNIKMTDSFLYLVYLYTNIPTAILCYAQLHSTNRHYKEIRKKRENINWNEYFRNMKLTKEIKNIEKELKLESKLEEVEIKNII